MSESLRLTLVQTELLWEDISGNLSLLESKLSGVENTDMIVLPEMFTTGFTMKPENLAEPMTGSAVHWMSKVAAEKQATVCGSLIIEEEGNFYNRFIGTFPSGRIVTYDKKHLFTLAGEDGPYTSGEKRLIFEIKGWKVMPLICYDLRFPVWARSRQSQESPWEYDLVLYMANWPKPRIQAWDTLLQARAIENQAYCAGVNRIGQDGNGLEYIGHSAVYDFAGLPILDPSAQDDIRTVTLYRNKMLKFREKLPFQKDGDPFELKG